MRYLAVVAILFLLNGCSPRYEIKAHYTPPTTQFGKKCIMDCKSKKSLCLSKCDTKYNRCLERAEKSAKDNLNLALKEYDRELSEYKHELERYTLEIEKWQFRKDRLRDDYYHYKNICDEDRYGCRRFEELRDELSRLDLNRPIRPTKPEKPSLENEIKKFQKNCSRDCGCDKRYDECFTSCGGKVKYEKICVENCN